ncbi:PP2C family protein-serine/threonine phosphatase [Streptomyces collinus]|uniref:PP2C family protein-serine/threonine phosphatase n=1 Tax=Streptomyces collinus TaxID=42684 RepID=UPI00362975EC
MISCGHPPPLLLSRASSLTVPNLHPAPPLGIVATGPDAYAIDAAPFEPGDTLLLYTDGVVEARDRDGRFYPLETRLAHWHGTGPESLLHHIHRDLLAHTRGHLNDDVALVALHRHPNTQGHRRYRRVTHAGGSGHSDASGAEVTDARVGRRVHPLHVTYRACPGWLHAPWAGTKQGTQRPSTARGPSR